MRLVSFPAAKKQFTVSGLLALLFLVVLWRTSNNGADSVVGPDDSSESELRHMDDTAHLEEIYRQRGIIVDDDDDDDDEQVVDQHQQLRRGLQKVRSDNILLSFWFSFIDFLRRLLSYAVSRRSLLCEPPSNAPPLPGKKGIGLTMRADGQKGPATENIPKVKALSVSWNYSWGRERPEGQPENVEFVPMIWGASEANIAQRIADVQADFDAGRARRLLGFNEPDQIKQSNIPVERAISLWKHFEDSGIPLVSPSPAHSKREWMTTFMKEVDRPNSACLRMEWIGVHWYGSANAQSFKNHMADLYSVYGSKRPLLITEFAPADWTTGGDPSRNRWNQEMVLNFAKDVLPWLEQQDFIAGYAWFSFKQDSPQGHTSALFDLNGDLTTLGRYYASVTSDNIYGDQSIGAQ